MVAEERPGVKDTLVRRLERVERRQLGRLLLCRIGGAAGTLVQQLRTPGQDVVQVVRKRARARDTLGKRGRGRGVGGARCTARAGQLLASLLEFDHERAGGEGEGRTGGWPAKRGRMGEGAYEVREVQLPLPLPIALGGAQRHEVGPVAILHGPPVAVHEPLDRLGFQALPPSPTPMRAVSHVKGDHAPGGQGMRTLTARVLFRLISSAFCWRYASTRDTVAS